MPKALIDPQCGFARYLKATYASSLAQSLGRYDYVTQDGFLGGKVIISDFPRFFKALSKETTPVYLSETVTGKFRFFVDIDHVQLPDAAVRALAQRIAEVVATPRIVVVSRGGCWDAAPAPEAVPAAATAFIGGMLGSLIGAPALRPAARARPRRARGRNQEGIHMHTDLIMTGTEALALAERINQDPQVKVILGTEGVDLNVYKKNGANLRPPLTAKCQRCPAGCPGAGCQRCAGKGRFQLPDRTYLFHSAIGYSAAEVLRLRRDGDFLLEETRLRPSILCPEDALREAERLSGLTNTQRWQHSQRERKVKPTESVLGRTVQQELILGDPERSPWFVVPEALLQQIQKAWPGGILLRSRGRLSALVPMTVWRKPQKKPRGKSITAQERVRGTIEWRNEVIFASRKRTRDTAKKPDILTRRAATHPEPAFYMHRDPNTRMIMVFPTAKCPQSNACDALPGKPAHNNSRCFYMVMVRRRPAYGTDGFRLAEIVCKRCCNSVQFTQRCDKWRNDHSRGWRLLEPLGSSADNQALLGAVFSAKSSPAQK